MTPPDGPGPAPRQPPDEAAGAEMPSSNLPARRLSTSEVEAVLRRAVELQSREGDRAIIEGEGMAETELLRIGNEIGLSPRHIQQALAETGAEPVEEDGWFGRGFGPAGVRASRLLGLPASRARDMLDRYFRETESMVPHRRYADRVVYHRSSGFAAELQRLTASFNQKYKRIDLPEVEVGVRPADERTAYVSLRSSLSSSRNGHVAGGLAGGSVAGGVSGLVAAVAVAPPVALVAVPVFLGTLLGSRAGYRHQIREKQNILESVLDRLEHDELVASQRPGLRRRLGF